MSKTLTIVGASARAAAQSAARSGFCVYAGDLFADVDLRHIATTMRSLDYPRDLELSLRGSQSGGWMYTGSLENYPRLVRRWSNLRPLWGNPPSVLRRVRNPLRVNQVLHRAGFAVPEVQLAPTGLPHDGSWLAKPLRSAGGLRIAAWHGVASLRVHDAKRYYFQRRISGLSYAAVYVATNGGSVLLGITEQLLGSDRNPANQFRYRGSIGPIALRADQTDEFRRLGNVLAAAFELTGLFGVDVVLNTNGIWPIEVNPRYTASVEVIERVTGVRAVAAHVQACQEGVITNTSPVVGNFVAGKAIVYATRETRFPGVKHLPMELQNAHDGWSSLADYPADGTRIEDGWPIATVRTTASCTEEAVARLDQASRLLGAHCQPPVGPDADQ